MYGNVYDLFLLAPLKTSDHKGSMWQKKREIKILGHFSYLFFFYSTKHTMVAKIVATFK